MKIGLIGKHITHSYSKEIHEKLGQHNYKLYDIESVDEVKKLNLDAFNITHPYKQDIFDFVDEVDGVAKETNAINTVIKKDNLYVGYNTDYDGFKNLLDFYGVGVENKHVIVLGNGATSRTIAYYLRQNNVQSLTHLVRQKKNNHDDLLSNQAKYKDTEIIINTTPVGMYPHTDDTQIIDFKYFPNCDYAIDIIYNPFRTNFLLNAEEHHIKTVNGLYMLLTQAVQTESLIQNKSFSEEVVNNIYHQLLIEQVNIVLIGLPFSGKSTIGNELAKSLKQPHIDTDELIEKTAQSSIPSIFESYGESRFRQIEKDVVYSLIHERGTVISSGGGVILDNDNMNNLKQNGIIIYINKDINYFDEDQYSGRPLIKEKKDLLELSKDRSKLYKQYGDIEYIIDESHPHHIGRIKAIIYEYFNH